MEATQPCRLLDLPPELRNEIYNYVLFQPAGVLVRDAGLEIATDSKPHAMRSGHPIALLGVCKQIRSECAKLYLALNHFKFSLPVLSELSVSFDNIRQVHLDPRGWARAERIIQWIKRIGRDVSHLRSIHIELGNLQIIAKEHKNFLLRLAAWLGELGNTFRRRRVHFSATFNMHGLKTGLSSWTIPFASYSKNEKCIEDIIAHELQLVPGSLAVRFPHHLRTRHKWLQWFNSWVRICHVLSGTGRKGVRHMNYDALVIAWDEWRVTSSKMIQSRQ